MSEILDENGEVLELVLADLLHGCSPNEGREGMSAEQVTRALVIKQLNGFSYDQLAFHLLDSITYRTFCRFGLGEKIPKKSALQDNIRRLRPETLQALHECLMEYARREGIETGKVVRGDCTVVETNIRKPSDSLLLVDCIQTLVRLMKKARTEVTFAWADHHRRAKRRALRISNCRGHKRRAEAYQDLLKVTHKTVGYAQNAAQQLDCWWPANSDLQRYFQMAKIRSDIRQVIGLTKQVIDQTRRRVLWGEKVPASEKILSIFEPHTDIIIKGGRGPEYGHKVFLTSGRSGLVLDCKVLQGNPADSTLVEEFLSRHTDWFGEVPHQVAFDGGFTSAANLAHLKDKGVQDVAFHKKRSLSVSDMVRSTWIYKTLKNFRAGIESHISFLKRCFGLSRCLWRGFESFLSYVTSSVVTANLLVLARHRMKG